MTEVFSYLEWDCKRAVYVPVARKRSAEGIISCTGEIISGSGEDVPDDAVDAQGFYTIVTSNLV